MRWFWLIAMLIAACDDSSGFAGTYQTASITAQGDGCDGSLAPQQVLPDQLWFKLADTDGLVAYYHCSDAEHCDDLYDLTLSFGPGKDGDGEWAGYVASALPDPTCILRYQVRQITIDDGGELTISQHTYRMVDSTLSGAACTAEVASMRGETMSCVDRSVQIAERQ